MERVLDVLHRNGLDDQGSGVIIQSFEVGNLQWLHEHPRVPLMQLTSATGAPADFVASGDPRTYADLVTPLGLRGVAQYATYLGPDKNQIIPRDASNHLTAPTSLVADAHPDPGSGRQSVAKTYWRPVLSPLTPQNVRVDATLEILGLAITVVVVGGASRRYGWPAPVLLVAAGVIASYIPGVPTIEINPDVILVGLLPPLLYAAAIRTSLVDFRANRQAIVLLSVGLVAFTTFGVGLAVWWAVPAVSLAAAFALGAVVAPTDAVAATATARRVGMPRRIVSILEGESLVNDATALVALNTAIAAITGKAVAGSVALNFFIAAGGGFAIGLAAAAVLLLIRKHIRDPVLDTALSFVAPYIAFLPAQLIHSSGPLAVVVCGLILGHKSPVTQTATSRISEDINWRTVQFLLENAVFILIGLQLRAILQGINDISTAVVCCVVAFAATIAARFVWVFGVAAIYRIGTPGMRENAWSWRACAVVSWAGMRGVVTLAAALLLPEETPARDSLQLAAFAVVAGSLLLQGLTLPELIRRVGLRAPNIAEDALQYASLMTDAARAGSARLEEIRTPDDPPEVIEQLHSRTNKRTNSAWERLGRPVGELEPPSAAYRRLRMQMLQAERGRILEIRDAGLIDDDVLRTALSAVDFEESLLDRIAEVDTRVDNELLAPPQQEGECEHLRAAPRVAVPQTPGECPECVRDGTTWVHLRLCLACGHVGCCESSIGNHAAKHFADADHPVMRSIEPGEAWRWCYIDERLG
jgi:monovalent cation/hydrogen antiporter